MATKAGAAEGLEGCGGGGAEGLAACVPEVCGGAQLMLHGRLEGGDTQVSARDPPGGDCGGGGSLSAPRSLYYK